MSRLTTTLLTADDWQRYREIRLAALADAPYAFGGTLASALSLDEQAWRERAASNVLLVTTPTGHDVGIGGLWLHPEHFPVAMVVQMWVDPAARGFGVGRLVLDALVERARELGVEELVLHVTEGNERAASLYRSAGWQAVGEPEPVDPDDPSRGAMHRMTRNLGR